MLPPTRGLSVINRLEECLCGLNSSPGQLNGAIDRLVRNNIETAHSNSAMNRLVPSPVAISQEYDLRSRIIHTQSILHPANHPARLFTIFGYDGGTVYRTLVPLQFLLKGWGDAEEGYQGYVHSISKNVRGLSPTDTLEQVARNADSYYYVGITGRNWLQRLEEHFNEARAGSRRWFYEAWRDLTGEDSVHFLATLSVVNLSYDDAMNWEESMVDRIAWDEWGLNMIPGGFKGIRLLHQHRLLKSSTPSLEEREAAIRKFTTQSPLRGRPNPFVAEAWKSEEHYLRFIESNEKMLNAAQVREIRRLHADGLSADEIVKEVNARSLQQVANVIVGRTYRRVQ